MPVRGLCASGPVYSRIQPNNKSSSRVPRIDIAIDPMHPIRFEKKNMRISLQVQAPRALAQGACR